jgi:anti-sigma-K factor RskA
VQQTLEEFPAPEVSPDFDNRLYSKIAAEEEKRAGAWWRKLLWRPVVPLAAAAAVVAIALVVRMPDRSAPVEDPKQASVDLDVQQLEQALEDLELLMPL